MLLIKREVRIAKYNSILSETTIRACEVFSESKILTTEARRTIVLGFLGFGQRISKRLYMASVNGWRSEDFHRLCNNKGPTLTISHGERSG
jgi:hypothetical protein